MKIKSKEHFIDVIQAERAWRRKELTNLKGLIHQSRDSHNKTLVRAGILLLYSHWEGYVKKVCEAFFYYMNFKAHKYSDLKPNFLALGLANEFNGNFPQKKFDSYLKAIDFSLNKVNETKFKIDVVTRIDTKSNLTTEVLVDLLNMLGLDSEHFKNNQHYIDSKLVKYRNAIAHGERTENNPDLSVNEDEFNEIYTRINDLIDYFENIVSNHVEMETYKIN
ncbi:MAE_28990/MAE_18760 family HEPN-like nuclease [Aliivibrio sifiae]|uniref:RiboL-PSP-HEPN domain-containing protein n=1 Tax=Aliivibrio sifiae TaxID=566293 RepID=A0A2S7X8N6_9GAMM|nr:MAE_28990/MAE_18760 family HEPN-like nuclease [Aliivibrio sifiae]PQJ87506.1 hypothetical protein BTO23_15480 [Aliivibrio sifiae]GLR77136.1 hypothetical protein GCM10007855_40110 [Aliivibrio sifiae]